jgi:hypothetical protein
MASAQEMPDWAKNRKIDNPNRYYFGIGISTESQKAADDDARKEFAKMVESQVESFAKQEIKEKNYKVDEKFESKSSVESKVSLQGVYIEDRYYDKNDGKYYSLIKFARDDYHKHVKKELANALKRLEAEYDANLKKEQLAMRNEREMNRLNEEKKAEELRKKQAKEARKQKLIDIWTRERANFIKMQPYHRLINMENAEIAGNNKFRQEASVRGGFYPINFTYFKYTAYYQVLALSAGLHSRSDSLFLQDAAVKFRLLNGQGKIFKTSVALGIGGFTDAPFRFNHFSDDLDSINYTYNISGFANIHIPSIHTVVNFMADFRKVSLGFQHYPLFRQMENKLAFIAEVDYTWEESWRNRHKDALVFSPGIQFIVIPGKFYSQLSYEQNEYFTLAIDYQF